ncbi:MAG TPA: hypothetical protein VIG49_12240 [Acetobacteraceae bacterium]|jgi:hypothetical protein
MASASAWIMSLTVVAGVILALWHMRGGSARPPALAGVAHGVAGAIGLGTLLLALGGPVRGVAFGAGSFGSTAAWLFAAALLSGGVIWWRRRDSPAVLMVVHAGFAVTAWVLLLAWASLG